MVSIALLGFAWLLGSSAPIVRTCLSTGPCQLSVAAVRTANLIGVLALAAVAANWDPSIKRTDAGLTVEVFLLFRVLIPWNAVLDVRPTLLPGLRMRLIVVRKLTFAHRLFGMSYGLTTRPCIPVRDNISGYGDLLDDIKVRLGTTARGK
jgi:hypothetical protein